MQQLPSYALNEFLEIINVYGSFLKEREFVKNFNKEDCLSNPITTSIHNYKTDHYSWQYQEYGVASGISTSETNEFLSTVNNIFITEQTKLTKNLISTEKHFKKLKHEFRAKYPELTESFESSLKEHQVYTQNKKRAEYQKFQSIINLSDRFISFYHYNFGGGEGLLIAYRQFANDMNQLHDISTNASVALFSRLDTENKKIAKLSLEEIEVIAVSLKRFSENVAEINLEQATKYINDTEEKGYHTIKEKKDIAADLVNKNIIRFKKLYSDYIAIKNQ